jgi:predicted MPP superfamily phosphohydrolase
MEFYKEINACSASHILITGDIAEAISLEMILAEMSEHIDKYIYFVLGNHDYYHGAVDEVKTMLSKLPYKKVRWLPGEHPVWTANVTLIGTDSWADGRYGNYHRSEVVMNDSKIIYDLYNATKNALLTMTFAGGALLTKMQELADKDAHQLWCTMENAIQNTHPERDHDLFVVLTHIPPFPEVCKYNRSNTDKAWLPFYSCKATGDVLLKFANEHPEIKVLVLCGHTHSAAEYQPLPNLLVKCGGSEYYHPKINEILEFDINNEFINKK